jgi:uncharacterized protein YciI
LQSNKLRNIKQENDMNNEQRPATFRYLDSLRKSGRINMFGAAPHLAEAFGLSKNEAREVLRQWMESFKSEAA